MPQRDPSDLGGGERQAIAFYSPIKVAAFCVFLGGIAYFVSVGRLGWTLDPSNWANVAVTALSGLVYLWLVACAGAAVFQILFRSEEAVWIENGRLCWRPWGLVSVDKLTAVYAGTGRGSAFTVRLNSAQGGLPKTIHTLLFALGRSDLIHGLWKLRLGLETESRRVGNEGP